MWMRVESSRAWVYTVRLHESQISLEHGHLLAFRVWFIQEFERLALALNGRWDMEEVLMSEQECL